VELTSGSEIGPLLPAGGRSRASSRGTIIDLVHSSWSTGLSYLTCLVRSRCLDCHNLGLHHADCRRRSTRGRRAYAEFVISKWPALVTNSRSDENTACGVPTKIDVARARRRGS
jgi:hypothetical protein